MKPEDYKPLPPQAHAFLDGTLDSEAEADFRRALDADPALRADVEELRDSLALLRAMPQQDPGPQFHERVMGRVRESELIDRARRRITGARAPIWQHVAQVAAGAVAAAVILALLGLPGREAPQALPLIGAEFNDAGTAERTDPSEEDLLPALGEQLERFRRMGLHVAGLTTADAESQRELIRAELEFSGLLRRNRWLQGELAGLSPRQRREYEDFLKGVAGAIAELDAELSRSTAENRSPDLGRISGMLDAVSAPARIGGENRFRIERFGAGSPEALAVPVSAPQFRNPEVSAYAAIRAALYSNDTERTLAACRDYLRPHGTSGRFARQARLIEVACLLRLGRSPEAARGFEQTFGVFGEGLNALDQRALSELLSAREREQLRQAREALRAESYRD